LCWTLALPVAGGLAVLALPEAQAKRPWMGARAVALAFGAATLIVAGRAGGLMDYSTPDVQFTARLFGLRGMGIGVDGFSMPLVLLAAGMGMMASLASYGIKQSVKSYFTLVQFWLAAALGVLVAREGVALAGCLLAAVVLMYFLMAGWGTERKLRAARRYLYLTLPALACALAGTLSGGGTPGGGANPAALPAETSTLGFWAMFAGFGILTALTPVHWWLSEVVTEASTPIAMLTVGVMQTLGAYGLLRLGHPLFAHEAHAWPAGLLGAITMAYGALAALGQKNLKRMAAYVSISLMGCVVLGGAMGTAASITGAVFLLAAHAVGVGMMVFVAGMIQDRLGHTDIPRLGGLGGHMPALAGWGAMAFLGAMGLPGLCVFAGEVLVVMGTLERSREGAAHGIVWLAVTGVGAMALLLGGCVWTYQRVFLGAPRPEHSNVARMSVSERSLLAIFGLAVVALGILPALLTDAVRVTAEAWLGR